METSHQNHKIDQNIIKLEYVPMDFTKTSNFATKDSSPPSSVTCSPFAL